MNARVQPRAGHPSLRLQGRPDAAARRRRHPTSVVTRCSTTPSPNTASPELRTLVSIYFDVVAELQARQPGTAGAVGRRGRQPRRRTSAPRWSPLTGNSAKRSRSDRARHARAASSARVDPRGLATVIIAMLRGVALQSLIDDHVDLDAAAPRSKLEPSSSPHPTRSSKESRAS